MSMFIEITPEDIQRVYDYINNDNREVLNTDSIKKMNCLCDALRSKMQKDLYEDKKRIFMLERKLERYQKIEQDNIEQGNFIESTRDSYDVAMALLYCLQQLRTYKLTKSKFLLILYEAYASWLAGKKERLFAEHPVASEYGPQFWRVYKRLNLSVRQPYSAFENIANENPGIAKFLKNVANKYYDYNEGSIKKPIVASAPYKNALPEHNGGKWNKEINDADIFVWRKERK